MEKTYWLARKRQSLAMARTADHSIARLIHYDLAGRYGIKAHNVPAPALANLANILAFVAVGCIVLAFATWLTSRGRAALSIPPVLRRVRKFRTGAAASLLLAAVLIAAIAAAIAVLVRVLG